MKAKVWLGVVVAAVILGGPAAPLGAEDWHDKVIRKAFEEVLDREPSDRDRMYDDHWTERDIKDDLRNRSDYGRHSDRRVDDPDRIVRRAYEDILHREPDAEGLRLYRRRIIDDNWSEYQVREALRKSPEHGERDRESADRIVRRAYQDVLGRAPDHQRALPVPQQDPRPGLGRARRARGPSQQSRVPPEEHHDAEPGRAGRAAGLPERARPRARPEQPRLRRPRAARPLERGRRRPRAAQQRRVPQPAAAERHYGWKAGVPAYLLASAMAASRLQRNKHHLGDVVAGATLGYLVGRTVVRENGRPLETERGPRVSLVPILGRRTRAVSLAVAFERGRSTCRPAQELASIAALVVPKATSRWRSTLSSPALARIGTRAGYRRPPRTSRRRG